MRVCECVCVCVCVCFLYVFIVVWYVWYGYICMYMCLFCVCAEIYRLISRKSVQADPVKAPKINTVVLNTDNIDKGNDNKPAKCCQ